MDRRHRRGRLGEDAAARHLESEGWTVLARNWRDGPRELDLVAYRAGVLAFVEVKTRGPGSWGHPLEAITWRKRREIELAARAWLRTEAVGLPGRPSVRFDAAAVRLEPGHPLRIEYFPSAWRPGEPG